MNKPILTKQFFYKTKFIATDQAGGSISSELMVVQSLLMFHYGINWGSGPGNTCLFALSDNSILYVDEVGELSAAYTDNKPDYRALTIFDIMPNQYKTFAIPNYTEAQQLELGIEIVSAMKANAYGTTIEAGRFMATEETIIDEVYLNNLSDEDKLGYTRFIANQKERLQKQALYVADIALQKLNTL